MFLRLCVVLVGQDEERTKLTMLHPETILLISSSTLVLYAFSPSPSPPLLVAVKWDSYGSRI